MNRLIMYSTSSTDLVFCDINQVIFLCVCWHGKDQHFLNRRAICWAKDGLSVKIKVDAVFQYVEIEC